MHELRLIQKRRVIANVLKQVSLVDHLLEGLDLKKLLNLLVDLGIVSERRFGHNSIHETLHDLLILFFVEWD